MAGLMPLVDLSVEQVCVLLRALGQEKIATICEEESMTGRNLNETTDEDLKDLGVKAGAQRRQLLEVLDKYRLAGGVPAALIGEPAPRVVDNFGYSYFDSINGGLQAAYDIGDMMRDLDREAQQSACSLSEAVKQSQSQSQKSAAVANVFRERKDYLPAGDEAARPHLDKLLEHQSVRLIIVGEVSSGKSSLWNAILGTKIFPEAVEACTKRIAVVKYSDVPYIKLDVGDTALTESQKALLNQFTNETTRALATSMELPGEVGARKNLDHPELKVILDRIEQMEVGIPNGVLELGLVAIDSPGLNESLELTERTLKEMKRADNILFVLNASGGGFTDVTRQSLKTALSSLGSDAHEFNPLFLLNKVDAIGVGDEVDPEDTEEQQRTQMTTYRQELDSMCKATFDGIKDVSRNYSSIMTDINQSIGYGECRTFHPVSAKRVLKATTRGRPMPSSWIKFSDQFNTFAQHTLFAPLLQAGLVLDEHGSDFVNQLLSEQNEQQRQVICDLLDNKIPEAEKKVLQFAHGFKQQLQHRRARLADALRMAMNELRNTYLDWALEWTGAHEQDSRVVFSPDEKDQIAFQLLENLQGRLMETLSQQQAVQTQLNLIKQEFDGKRDQIVGILKNAAGATAGGANSDTQKMLDALTRVPYAPEEAVPKRNFARKHRVKLMIAGGVVGVGVGALAMWVMDFGKSPPWHHAKGWESFKREAAQFFYQKLDENKVASDYIAQLEKAAEVQQKAFQKRVQTARRYIEEMKDVDTEDLPKDLVARLARIVDLAHLNNASIASIKDGRMKPTSMGSEMCEIANLPADLALAAVQLKMPASVVNEEDYDAVKMVVPWMPGAEIEAQLKLEIMLKNETDAAYASYEKPLLALVPFQAPQQFQPDQINLSDLKAFDAPRSPCTVTSLSKANVVMVILMGTPEEISSRLNWSAAPQEDKFQEKDKFQASLLDLGRAAETSLGIQVAIGLTDDELAVGLIKGEHAIVEEFTRHGNAQDKDNLKYIMHGTALRDEDVPAHVKHQITTEKYHGGTLKQGAFDHGHGGMTLDDFVTHKNSRIAQLIRPHVIALRMYTTSSFPCFNQPLRNQRKPHPFAMSVWYLADGLRRLGAVPAEAEDLVQEMILWRGMQNRKLDQEAFSSKGGSERAPMSTSRSKLVACRYAASQTPLVFKYKTRGTNRGVSMRYLSVYPLEEEYLYPPLTYLLPERVYEEDGYTVVEVTPQMA
mmetsp:Transcript_39299/g.78550  ORF Transcript_39299/g.78550 Transcript_39299/m.78550 type:complete len:1222 (-) Transcript_39299:192-3857(-)